MIPIDQTEFSTKEGTFGNCFSACLASILEMPIEKVPNFMTLSNGEDVIKGASQWLIQYGFILLHRPILKEGDKPDLFWYHTQQGFDLYYIVTGISPRKNPLKPDEHLKHACVSRMYQIVHDPHPDKNGLLKITDYYFLLALNQKVKVASHDLYDSL